MAGNLDVRHPNFLALVASRYDRLDGFKPGARVENRSCGTSQERSKLLVYLVWYEELPEDRKSAAEALSVAESHEEDTKLAKAQQSETPSTH